MRTLLLSVAMLAGASATSFADKSLTVTSSAFAANGAIPEEYTCDAGETSPPLAWTRAPAGTKSLAVLVEDPDAPKGTFTHWLVTGIRPETTSFDKGQALPSGAIATTNDKGTGSYAGPCPPSGTHHYHFRVFALDTTFRPPRTSDEFHAAISGHVLAQGDLVGTYQRRPH